MVSQGVVPSRVSPHCPTNQPTATMTAKLMPTPRYRRPEYPRRLSVSPMQTTEPRGSYAFLRTPFPAAKAANYIAGSRGNKAARFLWKRVLPAVTIRLDGNHADHRQAGRRPTRALRPHHDPLRGKGAPDRGAQDDADLQRARRDALRAPQGKEV